MLSEKRQTLLLAFLVGLVSLLAYSQFFSIQLMEFDAVSKIVSHSDTGLGEVLSIFSSPEERFLLFSVNYRPVQSLVFWTLFLFNGLNFSAFHALNFGLHALNSVLVFFLARKLLGDKRGFFSFVAALVFALHPVQLNSVLFVSRLHELLVALFLLLSLLSLSAFLDRGGRRFYLLSIAFCFLGVFSKEAGSLIPFVLFFYCLVFLRDKKLSLLLRRSLRLCIPFFSLIAAYAVLMLFSLGRVAGYVSSVPQLASQSILVFFMYLFYPANFFGQNFLTGFYQLLKQPLAGPLFLVCFAGAAFLVMWFFSKGKQNRPVLFLFYWFFAFLFAFAASGFIYHWYLYIPLIPFALVSSLFLKRHWEGFKKSHASKLVSIAISLLFLYFAAFSPLFLNYGQPLTASRVTTSFYSQTLRAVEDLPIGSRLFLVNYPVRIPLSEHGLGYSIFLIEPGSVQAMLDFSFPEKEFKVFSLSSIMFSDISLEEKQFSFSSRGSCIFLIENLSPGKAAMYPSRPKQGKGEEEIILKPSKGRALEIEATLPEEECQTAFFLFFDGRNIEAIRASDFASETG